MENLANVRNTRGVEEEQKHMGAVTGFTGAALLLVAWVFQNYRSFTTKNVDGLDPWFVGLTLGGAVLLAWHAYSINDTPFIVLNTVISLLVALQLVFIYLHRN